MIGWMLLLPVAAGSLLWLLRRSRAATLAVTLIASLGHLLLALLVCRGGAAVTFAFAPVGFEIAFAVDGLTKLYLLMAAGMFPLLAVFSWDACKAKPWGGAYLFCLYISLAMIDGALLSDHLALTLFFWEGLLCTMFGMLLLRNAENPRTATKALVLGGTADLLLMLGIALTIHAAGTGRISQMRALPIAGWGAAGCACLLAGALGKAGCMPFHSWIPDAAQDAPTPFLAAFPGSLEKIAGVYLASRVITQVYAFAPGSGMSLAVSIVGAVTLLGGVAMALIQKDMKRLLAYHAISQVGYIVLGLGTGLAVGVAGGAYHLLNNVLYKSGLFMVAGIVEARAGTTDLHQLGGLRRRMPVTTACMVVFALSIAGFPGTNGFTSKELIFDAALETHVVFYLAAVIGAFMTAASFLKLTRAAFFGKEQSPITPVREAGPDGLTPTVLLALACLLCAVWPALPLDRCIGAAYGFAQSFAAMPKSPVLVGVSCAVLALAVLDHWYGSRKTGSALQAADHLHYAPGAKQFYALAEKGAFDPYRWLMGAANGFSVACAKLEQGVSWLYDKGVPGAARWVGDALSRFDNGRLSRYLLLAVCGLAAVGLIFLLS